MWPLATRTAFQCPRRRDGHHRGARSWCTSCGFFSARRRTNTSSSLFAFIPARYDTALLLGQYPAGRMGRRILDVRDLFAVPAPSWLHLGVNIIWFLPFGSAVARRFGALRFLAFFAVTAAAGALAHLFAHAGDNTGGHRRFRCDLRHHGGGDALCLSTRRAARRPARGAATIPFACRQSRFPSCSPIRACLIFLIVWFGINILFGIGSLPLAGDGRRSPGRRISAAFSPACCCFPGSIPRPDRAPPQHAWCDAAMNCGAHLDGTGDGGRIVLLNPDAGREAPPGHWRWPMNVKTILAAKKLGGDNHQHRADRDARGGGKTSVRAPYRRGGDPRRRRAPRRHIVGARHRARDFRAGRRRA